MSTNQSPCALLDSLRIPSRITGTVRETKASLDFNSALALDYSVAWLANAGANKVPASGVLRRALALYVHHLNQSDTDPEAEVRAVRSAASARRTDAPEQESARKRLSEAQAGSPFPSFWDVLSGFDWKVKHDAFNERVEGLVKDSMASGKGRFIKKKEHQQQEAAE